MHLAGLLLLLLLPLCVCVQLEWTARVRAGGGAGVNFGPNIGSESAKELVQLLRSRGIRKIRLHDADIGMLRAFGSSSSREALIEVIVGVRDDEIVELGVSSIAAQGWVARNVVPYFPDANIIAIAVGNEVFTAGKQLDHDSTVPFLVPAMRNLHAALSELGLEKGIKVSAPQSARVLSRYSPSSGAAFNMASFLEFLASSGSYVMLNLYPLDLQLKSVGLKELLPGEDCSATGGGTDDPKTGRHLSSIFDVLIDAASAAMASPGQQRTEVLGIEMEWSRTSSSSTWTGLAVDIESNFVEDLVMKPEEVVDKIQAAPFSSRRFLVDRLQAETAGVGKRRKLANKSWCVAKPDASTQALQSALDWACGTGGANCQPLQVGQSCFLPNTIVAHASYAFNSYYQSKSWASGSCDFGGIAQTTTSDPSTTSCLYGSSTSANGTPSTPTGQIVPSIASRLAWDRCRFILTSFLFLFLIRRTTSDSKI